jgi:hypothetical protein
LCDDETRKLWKLDQKYREMFEMCYWRRMENISWTGDHTTNEEVLRRVKKERNILQTTKKK